MFHISSISSDVTDNLCLCDALHAFSPPQLIPSHFIVNQRTFPKKIIPNKSHSFPREEEKRKKHRHYQVIQHSRFPFSLLISMQKSWYKVKPQIQRKVNEARLAITMGLWECFAPRLQPYSVIMLCIMFLSKREYKEWIAWGFHAVECQLPSNA